MDEVLGLIHIQALSGLEAMRIARRNPGQQIDLERGEAVREFIQRWDASPDLASALAGLLLCCEQHERLGHIKSDPRWDAAREALRRAGYTH